MREQGQICAACGELLFEGEVKAVSAHLTDEVDWKKG